jgi:catalase
MPTALQKTVKPEVTRSTALSLMSRPGDGSIRAGRVALIVADGVDAGFVSAMTDALVSGGAVPRLVGSRLGSVQTTSGELEVDTTVEAMPSVLFDAVVVSGSDDVAATLARDGRVLEFLKDQYRHCKPMLAWGSASAVFEAAGIPQTLPDGAPDPGIVLADEGETGIEAFIAALGKHRHFERETDPPRV